MEYFFIDGDGDIAVTDGTWGWWVWWGKDRVFGEGWRKGREGWLVYGNEERLTALRLLLIMGTDYFELPNYVRDPGAVRL